ncbi:hypothetical protein C8R47DRAFT_1064860 [Mycena vitilis]|nr:hypothetical protein C8R47DRAFT_1064860 [Mycena vitilis]
MPSPGGASGSGSRSPLARIGSALRNPFAKSKEHHDDLSRYKHYTPGNLYRTAWRWVKHKRGKVLRELPDPAAPPADETTPVEQFCFNTIVGVVSDRDPKLSQAGNFVTKWNDPAAKTKYVLEIEKPVDNPVYADAWDLGMQNLHLVEAEAVAGTRGAGQKTVHFFCENDGSEGIRLTMPMFEPKEENGPVEWKEPVANWKVPADCRKAFDEAFQDNNVRTLPVFGLDRKRLHPSQIARILPGCLVEATWKMSYNYIERVVCQVMVLQSARPRPVNVFSSAGPVRLGRPAVPAPLAGPSQPQITGPSTSLNPGQQSHTDDVRQSPQPLTSNQSQHHGTQLSITAGNSSGYSTQTGPISQVPFNAGLQSHPSIAGYPGLGAHLGTASRNVETYHDAGAAFPAPTWNTTPSMTPEVIRATTPIHSAAIASAFQSPEQFEAPHQQVGQGSASVIAAPRSHSVAIPSWTELERQSSFRSPHQFQSPDHQVEHREAREHLPARRSGSVAIPSWTELQRQGSFQSPHQFESPPRQVEHRERHQSSPAPPSESAAIPSWTELQRQGSFQAYHQVQSPRQQIEQRGTHETAQTVPRPASAAIPSWTELHRQGSFQSLSSLPPPPIPLSTRPASRASIVEGWQSRMAPPPIPVRPGRASPCPQPESHQQNELQQRAASTSLLGQQPSTDQQPTSYFGQAHGLQRTIAVQANTATPTTPPSSSASFTPQTPGRTQLDRTNGVFGFAGSVTTRALTPILARRATATPSHPPSTLPLAEPERRLTQQGSGLLPAFQMAGGLETDSAPALRTNGAFGFAGSVNTRALTPILARRATSTPSRPLSTLPLAEPEGRSTQQGSGLLPAFQMAGRLATDAALPFGFDTWGNDMTSLNETRAATPREPPHVTAADAAYLDFDSPQAQTPFWMGEYGDYVQTFGVEMNPRTPYDNDDAPLFLPRSDSDLSSSDNSSGESVAWEDSAGSEDSEPPLEKLKRRREAVLGKRKAVEDAEDETDGRRPRLFHRISFPSPTGGSGDEAEEDMAVESTGALPCGGTVRFSMRACEGPPQVHESTNLGLSISKGTKTARRTKHAPSDQLLNGRTVLHGYVRERLSGGSPLEHENLSQPRGSGGREVVVDGLHLFPARSLGGIKDRDAEGLVAKFHLVQYVRGVLSRKITGNPVFRQWSAKYYGNRNKVDVSAVAVQCHLLVSSMVQHGNWFSSNERRRHKVLARLLLVEPWAWGSSSGGSGRSTHLPETCVAMELRRGPPSRASVQTDHVLVNWLEFAARSDRTLQPHGLEEPRNAIDYCGRRKQDHADKFSYLDNSNREVRSITCTLFEGDEFKQQCTLFEGDEFKQQTGPLPARYAELRFCPPADRDFFRRHQQNKRQMMSPKKLIAKLKSAAKAAVRKMKKTKAVVPAVSTQAAAAVPTQAAAAPAGAPPIYGVLFHSYEDDVDPLPVYVRDAAEDANNYLPSYDGGGKGVSKGLWDECEVRSVSLPFLLAAAPSPGPAPTAMRAQKAFGSTENCVPGRAFEGNSQANRERRGTGEEGPCRVAV